MSAFTFREMMMTNLLLWGNAYAVIKRNRKGEIVELYPLESKSMTVERDPTTHLKHGEITERWFQVPVKSLTYDTRHFRTILLNIKEEQKENERAAIII